MKMFADHCFFASGVELLQKSGYDIIKASSVGLQKASDEEITIFCKKENRIILTLDNDFVSIYKFPPGTHPGIVVFRITPFIPSILLNILNALIERKIFNYFRNALVIVKMYRIMIIRPGGSKENI